jgi:hypothetical protein
MSASLTPEQALVQLGRRLQEEIERPGGDMVPRTVLRQDMPPTAQGLADILTLLANRANSHGASMRSIANRNGRQENMAELHRLFIGLSTAWNAWRDAPDRQARNRDLVNIIILYFDEVLGDHDAAVFLRDPEGYVRRQEERSARESVAASREAAARGAMAEAAGAARRGALEAEARANEEAYERRRREEVLSIAARKEQEERERAPRAANLARQEAARSIAAAAAAEAAAAAAASREEAAAASRAAAAERRARNEAYEARMEALRVREAEAARVAEARRVGEIASKSVAAGEEHFVNEDIEHAEFNMGYVKPERGGGKRKHKRKSNRKHKSKRHTKRKSSRK